MKLIKNVLFVIILSIAMPVLGIANDYVGTTAMNFLQINNSVKAESIGNAFTAGLELDALEMNPASIAKASQIEMSFYSLCYLESISFQHYQAVIPSQWGNFGFNLGYIDLGSQLRTTYTDREGAAGSMFANFGYQILSAYAVSFDKLNIGISGKYVAQTLDSTMGYAIGCDVGTTYQFNPNLAVGVALNNITLKKSKFVATEESLPQSLRMGVLYATQLWNQKLLLSSDVIIPNDNDPYIGLGVQYQLYSFFQLRGGYSSYNSLSNVSVGLGVILDALSIDFAYKPYKDFGPSYRVGIGFKL